MSPADAVVARRKALATPHAAVLCAARPDSAAARSLTRRSERPSALDALPREIHRAIVDFLREAAERDAASLLAVRRLAMLNKAWRRYVGPLVYRKLQLAAQRTPMQQARFAQILPGLLEFGRVLSIAVCCSNWPEAPRSVFTQMMRDAFASLRGVTKWNGQHLVISPLQVPWSRDPIVSEDMHDLMCLIATLPPGLWGMSIKRCKRHADSFPLWAPIDSDAFARALCLSDVTRLRLCDIRMPGSRVLDILTSMPNLHTLSCDDFVCVDPQDTARQTIFPSLRSLAYKFYDEDEVDEDEYEDDDSDDNDDDDDDARAAAVATLQAILLRCADSLFHLALGGRGPHALPALDGVVRLDTIALNGDWATADGIDCLRNCRACALMLIPYRADADREECPPDILEALARLAHGSNEVWPQLQTLHARCDDCAPNVLADFRGWLDIVRIPTPGMIRLLQWY